MAACWDRILPVRFRAGGPRIAPSLSATAASALFLSRYSPLGGGRVAGRGGLIELWGGGLVLVHHRKCYSLLPDRELAGGRSGRAGYRRLTDPLGSNAEPGPTGGPLSEMSGEQGRASIASKTLLAGGREPANLAAGWCGLTILNRRRAGRPIQVRTIWRGDGSPLHPTLRLNGPIPPEFFVASTSWIEVDLPAISGNVRVVRDVLASRIAGSASGGKASAAVKPAICAVMKADGYGLGAARVAKRLQLSGVEMLAVYSPEQARALVEAAITSPILMLMPLHDLDRGDVLYRAASRGQLHLTIHDTATLDAAVTITERLGLRLAVQLEVDTGMSRGGASLDEAAGLLKRIIAHPRLILTGVFNHFASADSNRDETRGQSEAFSNWLQQNRRLIPEEAVIHEANTFGTFRSSGFHRSMVRVGLALIGFAGEDFGDSADFEFEAEAARLTPAVRWMSQIVHMKSIDPGTPVGYGATWRAARPTRVGLVPVGYADGYPLSLSNQAQVGVMMRGGMKAFVPLIGRVSMDQITVDLTDVPSDQVGIGSPVEVVGNDRTAPNHLPTLAKRAGTIGHELLCRLSPRLTRQYLAVEKPVAPAITGTVAV